jgi:hypothetical protein
MDEACEVAGGLERYAILFDYVTYRHTVSHSTAKLPEKALHYLDNCKSRKGST